MPRSSSRRRRRHLSYVPPSRNLLHDRTHHPYPRRHQICGMISSYNTKEPYNVKNLQQLVWREITFNGFLNTSLAPKYDDEFYKSMPARVASGEIKYKEHLVKGLEKTGQALLDVLSGDNFGKSAVVVSEE